MSLLVVGSTAFDTVETPHGNKSEVLGGSCLHFSMASSLFTETRMVSVVGEDFPDDHRKLLNDRGIRLEGLQTLPGKTMRWTGKYSADMNSRDTLDFQANTFGDFEPVVPDAFRETPYVFLANAAPATQLRVLEQMTNPGFVVADTMDLWIQTARDDLDRLLPQLDGLILNDEEALQLTGENQLIRAGRRVLEMGPKLVIVKKGEHGSFLFSNYFRYALPAYPTERVVDPTGAGDAFAGGFMGFLASTGHIDLWNMKRAVAYGTITASMTVEGFSVDRIANSNRDEVERRFEQLIQFVSI